ncbi:heparinase II/III-family protein [Aliiglaciecola sp.]|nr:heparinase II/III-family protein [Aliiglaciecola sp.]
MWIKLAAYYRLGLVNLALVFLYRLKLKVGYLRRKTPIEPAIVGPFWSLPTSIVANPNMHLHGQTSLFGWYCINVDTVPNWHQSVLNQQVLSDNNKHWSQISDFDSGIGDIKGVWELSRFGWALTFASNYVQSADEVWFDRLNDWIADWSLHNPANKGVNWKCAQEASLRVLHLAAAAKLMKAINTTPNMCHFIEQHLKRILPTMGYAIGQDNNHGTSEAAALYVGGSWLLHNGYQQEFANRCMKTGLRMLVNRSQRLIMADGSFSQYSMTYHRLMLDSYSFVELWRKELDLSPLPNGIYQQLKLATLWLASFTDKQTGDAPNLGTNDGAHILNYSHAPFRDFRPSVELACQVFYQQTCFDSDECRVNNELFNLSFQTPLNVPKTLECRAGGFAKLSNSTAWCLLRVPNYLFRPSQADNLHLDLWVNGINLLRDGGSFSYNTQAQWLEYFSGCRSHNCIEFDQRPQMPKVSRFLFGQWPRYSQFDQSQNTTNVEYTDWQGVQHSRQITLTNNSLTVKDHFTGVTQSALLRWRVCPEREWTLCDDTLSSDQFKLQVSCDKAIQSMSIAQGAESRYYGKKSSLPVLEVGVATDATIITIISW